MRLQCSSAVVRAWVWVTMLSMMGCGGGGSSASSGTATGSAGSTSSSTSSSSGATASSGALPLGDGKHSTTPKVGYVMSCVTQWSAAPAQNLPWIQGDVWYPSEKPAVEGSVSWPSAQTTIALTSSTLTIDSNNLPDPSVQTTGIFPIQKSDPAYKYDANPNSIQAQTIALTLPANPTVASTPTCLPMGMIGFATDGVAIYDALDADGRDAMAHEVQDSCDAHPQKIGQYHYHGPSPCMPNEKTSGLVGYALDGFGIYGERDLASGRLLTDSDLDACHGTTSAVMWHGHVVTMYHYVLTADYPYTLGCFKGTPVSADLTSAQRTQIQNFH